MPSIDERIVEMDFDNAKFEKGVSETLKSLEKLDESTQLKDGYKGFDKLTAAASKFDLSGMTSAVESINNKFSVMGAIGFTVISRLTNAAIDTAKKVSSAITGSVMSGGMTRALNLEQAYFQFEGLGMDAEATMADVSAAVDGTAYSLDVAAKVAAQFGASGMRAGDDMRNALTAISGTAAMTGSSYEDIGNVFTKVAGQGRLMGDDLLSLSSRGVNAAATLATQMGKSEAEVRDMVTKGKVSFQDFANAMDTAFGEHATKANETFTGALSNVKSALGRIGAKFFTPFYENARDVLNAVRPVINQISSALDPAFTVVVNGMKMVNKFLVGFLGNLDLTELNNGIAGFVHTVDELYRAMTRVFKIGEDTGGVIEQGPLKVVYAMKRVVDGFSNIFSSFMNVVTPLGEAFKEVFPMDPVEILEAITLKFELLTQKFKIGENSVDSLKEKFVIFFNTIKNIGMVLKSLIDGGLKVLSPIFSLIGKLLGYVGTVFGTFLGMITSASPSVELFSDIINKGASGIAGFFEKLNSGLPSLSDFSDKVNGIKDKMSEFGANISSKVSPALEVLKTAFKAIAEWVGKAQDSAGDFISKIDWNTVFLGGAAIGSAGIIKSIIEFVKNIAGIGESVGGAIDSLKGALESLQGILESYQQNIKASAILKIAAAIGVLAVSLMLLSTLNAGQLVGGVSALGALMAELTAMVAVLNNIAIDPKRLTTTAVSLLLISTALLVLSAAMKTLAGLSWEEIGKGTIALAVLSGVLIGLTAAMNAIKSQAIGGAASMIVIGVALMVMAEALKKLGGIDQGVLIQGFVAMTAALGVLVVALNFMKSAVGGAVSMVIVSAALIVLAQALQQFGSLPMEVLVQGGIAIAAMLALLVISVNLMKSAVGGAAAMLIIAAAMLVLSGVISTMGAMPIEQLVQGMLSFIVMLTAFVAVSLLLAPVALQVLAISAAFLIFSIGMLVAAAALVVMSVGLNMLMAAGLPALGMLALLALALLPLVAISPFLLIAGAGFLALGVGLLAAGVAMLIFSMSSPEAIANMLLLGAAVVPLSALAPLMFVVGAGFLVLGVSALILAAGLVVLSLAFTMIGASAPAGTAALQQIAEKAGELAPHIGELIAAGAAFIVFGAGALVAGVACLVLGAGMLIMAAGFAALNAAGDSGIEALKKIGDAAGELAWQAPGLLAAGAAFVAFGAGALAAGAGALLSGIGLLMLGAGMTMFNALYPSAQSGFGSFTDAAMSMATVAPLFEMVGSALTTMTAGLSSMGSQTSLSSSSIASLSSNLNILGATISMSAAMTSTSASMISASMSVMVGSVSGSVTQITAQYTRMGSEISASLQITTAVLSSGTSAMTSSMSLMADVASSGVTVVGAQFDRLGPTVQNGINNATWAANNGGRNLVQGFINGANALLPSVYTMGDEIGRKAVEGINHGAGNRSPSHKTFKSGKYIDQGAINGMYSLLGAVGTAGELVGLTAVNSLSDSMSKIDSVKSNMTISPSVKPILDLSDISRGASVVNGSFSGVDLNGNLRSSQKIAYSIDDKYNQYAQSANAIATQLGNLDKRLETIEQIAPAIDDLGNRIDGMEVNMEGVPVGKIVAPTVSREIEKENVRASR